MTVQRIILIQGHPDASHPHLCHAWAEAYAAGACEVGHLVRIINVAGLAFPLLRRQQEWEDCALPAGLQQAQEDIRWAEHIVLLFPLWLGDMPALLKGFLEQIARPGFAFKREGSKPSFGRKGLTGCSARVVTTLGMPALIYRWYFRAHSIKALERNILGFVGIKPVHETLIGMVANLDEEDSKQ